MPKAWTPPPPATIEECHQAFESALGAPTYGSEDGRWPAYVNGDILAAFGEDEALDREAFVPRHDARMAERFPRRWPRPDPDRRAWDSAGNALHWGVRLGLLTVETGPDGVRRWRLVRREPTFSLDRKWRCEQVSGLPPEVQAARDRKAATHAKLTAALARKACAQKVPFLAQRLRWLLEGDPEFVVPEAWMLQGYVPEWTVGRALSSCLDTVRDAPLVFEFSKRQLSSWSELLASEGVRARYVAGERRRAEARAPIPDEDIAAIDALG